MEIEKLKKIAKEILDANPKQNICVGGTLMLAMRGIDLGREPEDIDIIINDYAPEIEMPDSFEQTESIGSGATHLRFEHKESGVKVDVISGYDRVEVMDGIKIGTIQKTIDAKREYISNDTDPDGKHKQDMKILKQLIPTLNS